MVNKKASKTEKRDPQIAAILKPYQEDMKRYMGALKEEFESRVAVIAEQYKDIKGTLNSHTEMIGQVLVEIDDIKDRLKQKVDYADFVKLEKRVRALEVKH